MVTRDEKGRLTLSILNLSILFDDILEKAQNRKEVEYIVNTMTECLLLSAQDQLKGLDDDNPYDIEINL